VAETLELRRRLTRRILVDFLWQQAALVAVIALVVLVVVQRGTRPVRRLSSELQARPEGDLTPLAAAGAPRELLPLVDATNEVMHRLAHLLENQKRFVRDSAHQLRTPLAVLKIQAQNGLAGHADARQALQDMHGTVERATRLANQMLALAKVEQLRQQRDEHGAARASEMATDLQKYRVVNGTAPAHGPGVELTIGADIRAEDLQDLINELRNAGAEAIAIEDIRVIARTSVGGVPGSLDVDGFLLRDPITIRAIGRPDVLVGSLTRVGGIVAQLGATNPGATVDVSPVDKLMTLPSTRRDLVPAHGRPVA